MSVVARRYAQALFDLGKAQKSLKELRQDVQILQSWLQNSQDFKAFIENRFLEGIYAKKALEALAKKASFSTPTTSFLMLLADHRRLAYLDKILRFFLELVDESEGILRGRIVSATPLNETQIQQIKEALSQKLKGQLDLSQEVNENLLGGMILRIGSYMIDASLESRLTHIEAALKG